MARTQFTGRRWTGLVMIVDIAVVAAGLLVAVLCLRFSPRVALRGTFYRWGMNILLWVAVAVSFVAAFGFVERAFH